VDGHQGPAAAEALASGAVVVYELPADATVDWPNGFEEVWERTYGGTGLRMAVYGEGER
jgi:hypothetical protein